MLGGGGDCDVDHKISKSAFGSSPPPPVLRVEVHLTELGLVFASSLGLGEAFSTASWPQTGYYSHPFLKFYCLLLYKQY